MNRGLRHVDIEMIVINLLSSNVSAFDELGKIISDIKSKCVSHDFVFCFVPRSANKTCA